jgi:hypothetical protein
MKAILNNVLAGGNEVEAVRDGWYVKRPDGRLVITQKALAAFRAAEEKLEKLASLVKSGLETGADVEAGEFDAGIFEESRKNPNWRGEFITLGGDPAKVLEATAPKASRRVRVFTPAVKGEKPKGERLAPTNGEPLAPAVEE